MVDVLGADHMDAYPDVLAAVEQLGCDSKKVNVIIHQFVTLTEDGEPVKTLGDVYDQHGHFYILLPLHKELPIGGFAVHPIRPLFLPACKQLGVESTRFPGLVCIILACNQDNRAGF